MLISPGTSRYNPLLLKEEENVTEAEEVKKALGNPDLMAYGYVGHGAGRGELLVSGPSTKELKKGWNPATGTPMETVFPGLYVHHKLEYLWLLACNSIEPDRPGSRWMSVVDFRPAQPIPADTRVSQWSRNVSEFGYLIGFTGDVRFFNAKPELQRVRGSLVPKPRPGPSSRPATP